MARQKNSRSDIGSLFFTVYDSFMGGLYECVF